MPLVEQLAALAVELVEAGAQAGGVARLEGVEGVEEGEHLGRGVVVAGGVSHLLPPGDLVEPDVRHEVDVDAVGGLDPGVPVVDAGDDPPLLVDPIGSWW